MANPKRTVLGVEIGAREVRMVEMRGGGPEPQILKAGSVPLPMGALDGDRIVQIETVADLIRGLHKKLGCQVRAAIIGMGAQNVVTRILAVPRVPDNELRGVIEGELAHYQILQAGSGAFDYFRMDASSTGADVSPQVLLMAVEDRIAQGYRMVADQAGLQMLALEPVTLSLFRAAFSRLEAEPAALCLAITAQRSELSILDHTQLRIYRRMDIGSDDFIVGRKGGGGSAAPRPLGGGDTAPIGDPGATRRGPTLLGGDLEDTAELSVGGVPHTPSTGGTGPLPPIGIGEYGDIIPQAAASLANEIQKTLDYYRREYPNATAIGRIILTTNDPDAEALSEWLAQALRMDVRVADIPTNPSLPPQIASQLEPPQGLRFLGATGLALHALTPDWKQVPRFNLSPGGKQVTRQGAGENERLTAVMILSACILFGGLFFSYLWHRDATVVQHQIERTSKDFNLTQADTSALEKKILDQDTLRSIIQADNLPAYPLMNIITSKLPSDVGLTSVNIDRNGKIALEGKARDPLKCIMFLSNLSACPYLTLPRLMSETAENESKITNFRIETSLQGTQAAQDAQSASR